MTESLGAPSMVSTRSDPEDTWAAETGSGGVGGARRLPPPLRGLGLKREAQASVCAKFRSNTATSGLWLLLRPPSAFGRETAGTVRPTTPAPWPSPEKARGAGRGQERTRELVKRWLKSGEGQTNVSRGGQQGPMSQRGQICGWDGDLWRPQFPRPHTRVVEVLRALERLQKGEPGERP